MGIEIIGKLTQKNNGDFKLVDLADVDYDGTGKSAKQELEKKTNDLSSQIKDIINLNTKENLKLKKYDIGDVFFCDLYEGSKWKVEKQPKIGQYNIDFEDETQFEVTLKDNTKGYAVLDLDSVRGYCQRIQTEKYNTTLTLLRRRQPVIITCKGDSITFGQGRGVDMTDIETNFGDGSVYEHSRLVKTYPDWLQEILRDVYKYEDVTVQNYGYSGDHMPIAYIRHRKNTGATTTILFYGVNDNQYCTNNGLGDLNNLFDDNNQYSVNNFIKNYRKTIIREQLRGSSVILLTSFKWLGAGNTSRHGTISSKTMKYYKNATLKLAKELNLPTIDLEDILGGYTNGVALNGVHPNDFGVEVMAKRIAPAFIGNGLDDSNKYYSEALILPDDFSENIIWGNIDENVKLAETKNSFNYHFADSTTAYNYYTNDNGVVFSFYVGSDNMCIMPIMYLTNANATPVVSLDFGIKQPEYKLDIEYNQSTQDLSSPTSSFQYHYLNTDIKYNYPRTDKPSYLRIRDKGWHTLKITAGGLLNGFRIFNYDSFKLQKIEKDYNDYRNSLSYTELTLLNNCSKLGSITPAYRLNGVKYEFTGVVLNNNYNEKVKICDLALINVNTQTISVAYSKVQLEYNNTDKCLYWIPNTTSGAAIANIINLDGVVLYPSYI